MFSYAETYDTYNPEPAKIWKQCSHCNCGIQCDDEYAENHYCEILCEHCIENMTKDELLKWAGCDIDIVSECYFEE